MSSNNQSVPGMMYPTQKSMLAGNPRDSAIQEQTNMNIKQANMASLAGGRVSRGRVSRKGKRTGGAIVVPQFSNRYNEQSGPGTGTNSQITTLSSNSTQNSANSVYDKYASKGGSKRYRKGGNPNWHWGCYSGGRKTKTRRIRRNKKSRSKRRK
jgi:hypothetical protein